MKVWLGKKGKKRTAAGITGKYQDFEELQVQKCWAKY